MQTLISEYRHNLPSAGSGIIGVPLPANHDDYFVQWYIIMLWMQKQDLQV